MTETLSINDLPFDAFVDILRYLDAVTIAKCRRVCKQWKDYIDESDHIWQEICRNEFKYSSHLAKEKASPDCRWYHLFRNLKLWSKLMSFEMNFKTLTGFSIHDTSHVLNVDHGLLPVRNTKGIYLYDLSTLKYIHPVLPERNCFKIVNNDLVTIVQIRSGILLQRSVESPNYCSEDFFQVEGFVLGPNMLYFHRNRDVFKVNLTTEVMLPKFMMHCKFNIREITLDKSLVCLFTACGKIVTIKNDYILCVKPVNCPVGWVKDISYSKDVRHQNYICYSKQLYRIKENGSEYQDVEFLAVTALCFYVDVVLLGTKSGEILLYRLSDQKDVSRPVFETVTKLPKDKFATQINVCERPKGPVIIASTFYVLYTLEFDFYPNEPKTNISPVSDLTRERLHKLRDRLQKP